MYLMLGMKRSRMFGMLMGETVFNSVIALVIGLPVSLILTECVSLATARGIGMGIIGHKFSLSLTAILWDGGRFSRSSAHRHVFAQHPFCPPGAGGAP